MDSENSEVPRMQEGEMSAADRTREMEGAGRGKEKGWTEGGRGKGERGEESAWRFGEVLVAEREAHCPYRPAAESLLPNGARCEGEMRRGPDAT